jgi:hypothetical protein
MPLCIASPGAEASSIACQHDGSAIHNRVDLRLASQNLGCQGV